MAIIPIALLKGEKGDPGDSATAISNHEELSNLLGGDSTNGHYHLSKDERRRLRVILANYLVNDGDQISHEKLGDLLGGVTNQHYHMTEVQHSLIDGMTGESWTFTLEDDTTVTKKVALLS